jgi:hypothetical protein
MIIRPDIMAAKPATKKECHQLWIYLVGPDDKQDCTMQTRHFLPESGFLFPAGLHLLSTSFVGHD